MPFSRFALDYWHKGTSSWIKPSPLVSMRCNSSSSRSPAASNFFRIPWPSNRMSSAIEPQHEKQICPIPQKRYLCYQLDLTAVATRRATPRGWRCRPWQLHSTSSKNRESESLPGLFASNFRNRCKTSSSSLKGSARHRSTAQVIKIRTHCNSVCSLQGSPTLKETLVTLRSSFASSPTFHQESATGIMQINKWILSYVQIFQPCWTPGKTAVASLMCSARQSWSFGQCCTHRHSPNLIVQSR